MALKFWQAITWAETDQLCEIARFAETLGFEGLMSGDHALYPAGLSGGYPYSETGMPPQHIDSEYPDMWTSSAAMAAVTTKLKFVCGVYVLPLRNPIEVAKQAATLSILSGGRFVLGAGTGWMREEFDIYDVDFSTRGKRMDEMLQVLRGLWSEQPFDYQGDHFQFESIKVTPTPQESIPIYFGGAASIALKRSAREGDGWINTGNAAAELPALLQRLAEYRQQYGKSQQPFETLCGIYDPPSVDMYQQLNEQGMTAAINLPFALSLGERSSLDDKKRYMEDFANKIMVAFN